MNAYEKNQIIAEDLAKISENSFPWLQLRKKRILVSGANGFIASFLIKQLLYLNNLFDLELHVICLSKRKSFKNDRIASHLSDKSLELYTHDICDVIPKEIPSSDIVIHAASYASPRFYGKDPVGVISANTIGTKNLLDYAVSSNADQFLFFSSGEIYGSVNESIDYITESYIGELDILNPRSCYASSKRMGESMCIAWASQHNLNVKILRLFHTYGPGIYFNDGRVFGDFVADVVNRRNIVLRSDGLSSRPFCYLSDAVAGVLAILLHGVPNEAYNIGNPYEEITIRDLAYLLIDLFPEYKLSVTFDARSNFDEYIPSKLKRGCPSIKKAEELGWRPLVGLREGFRRTILSYNY